MKRPGNKDKFKDCKGGLDCICKEYNSYNKAIEEMNAWIDSVDIEGEIGQVIGLTKLNQSLVDDGNLGIRDVDISELNRSAKAIRNLLKGE